MCTYFFIPNIQKKKRKKKKDHNTDMVKFLGISAVRAGLTGWYLQICFEFDEA